MARRRNKIIDQLRKVSLKRYGARNARRTDAIVAKARVRSGLTEAKAVRLAAAETRAARRR